MRVIFFVVLFVLHHGIALEHDLLHTDWLDYRSLSSLRVRRYAVSQNAAVVCNKPGLTCGTNCLDVYLCTKTESGLHPVLTNTCSDGLTCSAGQCSKIPSQECSSATKYPFVCKSISGVYPDPADCKKYHYCIGDSESETSMENSNNLTHFEGHCQHNYAYNPLTTYCDIPIDNGICTDYVVPVCKTTAETGIIRGNPSMYYICLPYSNYINVLYPFIYICDHGEIYNGEYSCKPPEPMEFEQPEEPKEPEELEKTEAPDEPQKPEELDNSQELQDHKILQATEEPEDIEKEKHNYEIPDPFVFSTQRECVEKPKQPKWYLA